LAGKPVKLLVDSHLAPLWYYIASVFSEKEIKLHIWSGNPISAAPAWGLEDLLDRKMKKGELLPKYQQRPAFWVVPATHVPGEEWQEFLPGTVARQMSLYDPSLGNYSTKFISSYQNVDVLKSKTVAPASTELSKETKDKMQNVLNFVGESRTLVYVAMGTQVKVSTDGLRHMVRDLQTLDPKKYAVVLRITLDKPEYIEHLNNEIQHWKNPESDKVAAVWFWHTSDFPQPALLDSSCTLVSSKRLVFITHGGASSLAEAFRARLPVIPLPTAGDQIWNAESIFLQNLGGDLRLVSRQFRNRGFIKVEWENPYSHWDVMQPDIGGKELEGSELAEEVMKFVTNYREYETNLENLKRQFAKSKHVSTYEEFAKALL